MAQHLQQKLPLDSSLLKDLTCFNPVRKGKDWTLIAVGRISAAIPHVVTSVGVSFMSFSILLQPSIITLRLVFIVVQN